MKKNALTLRQKKIIEILTSPNNTDFITISNIAEKLGLSNRTVLRDMPNVEKWLYENDFNFIKKPGVGLIIDESLENKEFILELLEFENIKKEYTKEERKRIILGELILNKTPLKSYYFTSNLKISEGILNSDLYELENWLNQFNIKIIKRQGVGIYLEGSEENYRKVLSNILYSAIGQNKIIDLLGNNNEIDKNLKDLTLENKLLDFVEEDLIKAIQNVLNNIEKKYEFKLSDNSYIGLIIHLTLVIKRLQNGDTIIMDKDVLLELENMDEFKIAKKIANNLSKELGIEISRDEMGYITMHIKGAKLSLNKIEDNIDLNNLDIRKISSTIIASIENDFQIDIIDKDKLNRDLSNHLVPAISRLTMNLNIRNPLLDSIKEKYYEIFKACEKACEILKNIVNISKISESEIAYITLHFAAAIQRTLEQEKIIAVVACPSGVGTSRLLSSDIQRSFNNIIIKDRISIINIDIDSLKNQGIDCIISTVKLDIDYKCISVNPLLSEDDKLKLKNFTKEILDNKINMVSKKAEKKIFGKEEIQLISNLGDIIINLLSNIILKEVKTALDINDLIYVSSKLFSDNEEDRINIENRLLQREKLGTTYLKGYDLMLLHCKSDVIKECKFGVIQLKDELLIDGKKIKSAMLSLLPENAKQIELEVMSEISCELIENLYFSEIIKTGSIHDIKREIEKKLTYFYKNKVKSTIK